MKHKFLVLTLLLAFHTHQTHTMDKILGYFWPQSKPATKTMAPLVEFHDATEKEKKLVAQCNGLKLDNNCGQDEDTYRHQFLAVIEKHVAMIEKKWEGTLQDGMQLKQYLTSARPFLQEKFKATYPNTHWGKGYNSDADKEADQLIKFYASLRPQLIQNNTEKEYFKKRLDAYNEKIKDLRTLGAGDNRTMIQSLYHINETMHHAGKSEEETYEFIRSDLFQKDYSKHETAWDLYRNGRNNEIDIHPGWVNTFAWKHQQDNLIGEFHKLQRIYPNYVRRRAALVDEYKATDKQLSNIYSRTGFEKPTFEELCCCAPETPTEVLKIIHDNVLHITHSKSL